VLEQIRPSRLCGANTSPINSDISARFSAIHIRHGGSPSAAWHGRLSTAQKSSQDPSHSSPSSFSAQKGASSYIISAFSDCLKGSVFVTMSPASSPPPIASTGAAEPQTRRNVSQRMPPHIPRSKTLPRRSSQTMNSCRAGVLAVSRHRAQLRSPSRQLMTAFANTCRLTQGAEERQQLVAPLVVAVR